MSSKSKVSLVKPLLKWVGGKTQIIEQIIAKFPDQIQNYYEPFLGGGSVLLALLQTDRITVNGEIIASDINASLIYLYKNIQNDYIGFYECINTIIVEFKQIVSSDVIVVNRTPTNIEEALLHKENYYYWIRKQYNSMDREQLQSMRGSAMFLFLNKTCFRGIFRMGPNGFNVPYGNNKNPEIINFEHLQEIHALIVPVKFVCCSFDETIQKALSLDCEQKFIYMDPPYVPETSTSFVGYTKNGFNEHDKLFGLCSELTQHNIKWVLSNSDVEPVRNAFSNEHIETILCKRRINSKNPESVVNEVIIWN
jgi:DNA adenine methylase